MVISSLVIHCSAAQFAFVKNKICKMEHIDIVETHASKLAVVLETENTEDAVLLSDTIRGLDGVIDMELVAHFFEEEVLENSETS